MTETVENRFDIGRPTNAVRTREKDAFGISTRSSPSVLALDDRSPEGDLPDCAIPELRLPHVVIVVEVIRCRLQIVGCVDSAAARSKGDFMSWRAAQQESQGKLRPPVITRGDELFAWRPNGVEDDAAKSQLATMPYDGPRSPADHRLDEIRGEWFYRAGTSSGSRSLSLGASSGGVAGRSRGIGSSTGSMMYVRRGLPISTSRLSGRLG